MLDSALEPSYNLSKNLLLLPWILKLIVDMVNDSTPLFRRKSLPANMQAPRSLPLFKFRIYFDYDVN